MSLTNQNKALAHEFFARFSANNLAGAFRWLGHASTRATLDIYQHLYDEPDTAAALSSQALLGANRHADSA